MGYRSKFSLLLVGSFLSWQSSPAAFAQDPAQPHLSFYFNGPNAAQNLADAYGILKSKHPGLLYGNTHRQVTSACAAKGDFFDMAICEHIWPKEAWRISSFKQRFDTANLGSRNKSSAEDNRLPWTTVETEFTRDSVADPTIKSINDLTPSRRKLLCKMHSWDFFSSDALAELLPNFPTQQSGDCILRVDVVEQRATEKPIPAKIILLQPAYYLRLHATTEPSDMLKAESDVVKGVLAEDPSAIGNVLPRLKVGAPRAQTGTVDLTSFCTKENILAGRRLLHWPEQANGKSQSYLVIADPGVTQPITFGDESYNSPFLHPEDGNAGTLSFLCKDTIHDQLSDLERWVHAMSVATIAYGGHADILIGDEEKVHFSGLLQPGDGQFVPTSWVGRNQAFIPIPYVIVGSYDNQFRQTPQAMQQIYAAVKDTVSTARGLPIFAASERSGDRPANFRTDGGISHPNAYPSASECDELPTCLGATPTAMVVAALDSDGATLLNPEYYRLGSSVVWVAAPGSRMMTAVPSDDGTLKFAVESGSSFAAPAVAAIALALEAQQYGSLENWQVMARIAASSDLYKTDEKDATTGTNLVDLVRFGRVNASRAIQGAARGEDAIWFRGDAEPIYRHIEAPMGLPKGPDYKDTAWGMRKRLQNTRIGRQRPSRIHQGFRTWCIIWLGSARSKGAAAMHWD